MSVLYNIKELKLNGKSLKTVHVAPISSDTWKSNSSIDRNTWNTTDIVTMNALRNLVTSDRSIEFRWPDMLQNGTYYYDNEVVSTSGTTEYYHEMYYNGIISHDTTNDSYTFMNSSDTPLQIHPNGVLFLTSLVSNLQTSDEYTCDIKYSPNTLNVSGTVNEIIISDSFKLHVNTTSGGSTSNATVFVVSSTTNTTFTATTLKPRCLQIDDYAKIVTDGTIIDEQTMIVATNNITINGVTIPRNSEYAISVLEIPIASCLIPSTTNQIYTMKIAYIDNVDGDMSYHYINIFDNMSSYIIEWNSTDKHFEIS